MEIHELLEGNDRFRAGNAHEGLQLLPRRRALVIGCADPRVDPERVLGLELGDVAVVRNIGGRITPPTLATLAGLRLVGARARTGPDGPSPTAPGPSGPGGLDVIVLHHTDCGIRHLADDPAALAGFIGTDVAHVQAMEVRDPYASVRHDVALLTVALPAGSRVWGLVYDVTTGQIDITLSPGQTR